MGGPDPPFRFHALISEVFEIEPFYLVYLFTIYIGIPDPILVRVGGRGVFAGGRGVTPLFGSNH